MEAHTKTGLARVVAVGVSRFDDPAIRPLPFAAADAETFAAAFRRGAVVKTRTDGEATAGNVRDALLSLSAAGPEDAVYVFVATHAANEAGRLIVQAYDGPVSLDELLRPVWNGPARRVVLLLDIHRGATADGRPQAHEIAALFPPREGRSVLLSDDGSHGSNVSGELQAGIWAAHVTAAFAGEVPRARERDGTLTAGSLRAYLADEVSRSLARAYTDGRRQSPVVLAASDDEVLADPVPAEEPTLPPKPVLAGVRFFSEREVPVKALGGFRKGVHSPPTDTLASSREWVARLAEPDLAKELEEAAGSLRRHLGYKRRDVRADGPAGGAATVLTPDFAYHLTARQHPARPGVAVFRRTLAEVQSPGVLSSAAFAEAFPQGFQSLYCPFDAPAEIESLVDAIEDAEPPGLARIDYPTDLAWCELQLTGFDGRVRIEPAGLTVTAAGPAPPAVLAAQFAHVRRLLGGVGV
jgi:hypothetical protein